MWYPLIEMVFQFGSSRSQKAKMSVTIRSDGARRIDVGAARDVLLEDVVLDGARQLGERHTLASGDGDVERQQDRPPSR